MMGKRGQSNMFWIIIAAVIALVVMTVSLLTWHKYSFAFAFYWED